MSLFDFGVFSQPQSEGGNQISLFSHALPQQVIDEALCIGSNHENSRLTICAYFKRISQTTPVSLQNTMGKTARASVWMGASMLSGTMPKESA